MWSVDTSWLYALFDADDKHHGRVLAEVSVAGPLLVNPVILVEFLDLVRRRGGRVASIQAYEDMLRLTHLRFTSAPKPAGVARVMGRPGGLTWMDATAVATALDEGSGLRTFDAAQRTAFEALA